MTAEALPTGAMPRTLRDARNNGGGRYVAATVLCARPCSAPVHPVITGISSGYTHVCDKGHKWHRDRHGKWTAKP